MSDLLPLVVGLSGQSYTDPAVLEPAFRTVMWVCVGLLIAGGVLSAGFVRVPQISPIPTPVGSAPEPQPLRRYCPVDGPPLAASTNQNYAFGSGSGSSHRHGWPGTT